MSFEDFPTRIATMAGGVYDGATVTLTPWAAQALSDEERHAIAVRSVDLHCRLDVGKLTRRQEWVIRVSSWAKTATHNPVVSLERRRYAGLHLATCIGEALEDYALEVRYTPEEILAIASASGLV